MIADPRFYEPLGPLPLSAIAKAVGGTLVPPAAGARDVSEAASLDGAGPRALAFLANRRYAADLARCGAAAVCVRPEDALRVGEAGLAALTTPHPQAAFAQAVNLLFRPRGFTPGAGGIDPSAEVDGSAILGPGVVIGPRAVIGARVRLGPHVVIGPGVSIAEDGEVGPHAVIQFADIGPRVRILSGAAIGELGFGLGAGAHGFVDMPHLGRVVIGADVTIGANTAIDRGMLEDTEIADGVKIDNLVQVAHNVKIGRNAVLAGCCGVSGSVVIGEGAMLGGSVGVADHVTIGAGARLAGAALTMRDVPPGESWAGTPAQPIKDFMREVAILRRLRTEQRGKVGED